MEHDDDGQYHSRASMFAAMVMIIAITISSSTPNPKPYMSDHFCRRFLVVEMNSTFVPKTSQSDRPPQKRYPRESRSRSATMS